MYALIRSPSATTGSFGPSTTATVTPPPLTPGTLFAMAVGVPIAQSVSTVAVTSGTGTFTRVGTISSTNYRLELWIGRNFTGYPTGVTTTFTGSVNYAVSGKAIDVSADLTAAPTLTASAGNTATSTSVDTNTLTPAVGDLLLAGAVWASTSADTATASTGNSFSNNVGIASTTFRVSLAIASAMTAVASKYVYTIGSAEWAALLGGVTAADPAPTAALITKGRLTAALDANPGA